MDNTNRAARVDLPPVLRQVWVSVLLITLVSVAFSFIAYRLGAGPEFYRALSPPGEHFTDFSIYADKFPDLHSQDFFDNGYPFTYPAPLALIFAFFYRLGSAGLDTFLVISGLAIVVPAVLFGRALVSRGLSLPVACGFVATLLACSWPAILVFDRGNVEIFVWVALAIGVWSFVTGRSYVAAICFGAAVSLKLFPFVYLGLFVSTRRWKPLALAIATFFVITVASLAFVGPTIPAAFHGINDGLLWFKETYMGTWRPWEEGVDHSLFALVKFLGIQLFHQDGRPSFLDELNIYTYVTAIGGILLYILRIRFLPIANQVLALCIASILFTGFSGDGTLLHLYCGFAILVFLAIEAYRNAITVPGLQPALWLLAFIFSYESFFVMPGQRFEGEIKCFALTLLMFLVLRFPFDLELGERKPLLV